MSSNRRFSPRSTDRFLRSTTTRYVFLHAVGGIRKLRNVLGLRADILESALSDNRLFHVVRPLARLGFHFVLCLSVKPLPGSF
jgi:hypothetical protein